MNGLNSRVIPIRAKLVLDREVVQEALTCWNWALGNSRGPIHPIGAILEHTMPVYSRGIGHVVGNVDQQSVTAIHSNQRARKSVID